MQEGVVELHRRDIKSKEKGIKREGIAQTLKDLLETIQNSLFERAVEYRAQHTNIATNIDELGSKLNEQGGFVRVMWNGDTKLEEIIKEKFKATIRCLPDSKELDAKKIPCILSGGISEKNIEILIAKAY
jgi:prolyl-tRNA synthetase